MYKKLTITFTLSIFLLLVTSTFCFSQLKNVEKEYYKLVDIAESQIIYGQYDSALTTLKAAFELRNPYNQDLHNATVCAIFTKKINLAFKYCNLLAQKGIGENYFLKRKLFFALQQQDSIQWKTLIHNARIGYTNIKNKNAKIDNLINNLMDEDSKWNALRISCLEDSSKTKYQKDSCTILAWNNINRNLWEAHNLFLKYGYISEFETNPMLINDTIISNMPFFWELIVHSYQSDNKPDTFFTDILRQALYKGEIKPNLFALLQDFGSIDFSRPYYGTSKMYWNVNNLLYVIPYYKSEQILKSINEQRNEIGLCSIDELEKYFFKIKLNDKLDNFIFMIKPTTISVKNHNMAQSFVNQMKLLE